MWSRKSTIRKSHCADPHARPLLRLIRIPPHTQEGTGTSTMAEIKGETKGERNVMSSTNLCCMRDRTTCHDLAGYGPCNPLEKHSHGQPGVDSVAPWSFQFKSCDTVQECGHQGICGSGGRTQVVWTRDWARVLAFYNEHKTAEFCTIMAHRSIYTEMATSGSPSASLLSLSAVAGSILVEAPAAEPLISHWGSVQNAFLFIRCTGCGATDMPDLVWRGQPSAGCLEHEFVPAVVASPEEAAHVAAAVALAEYLDAPTPAAADKCRRVKRAPEAADASDSADSTEATDAAPMAIDGACDSPGASPVKSDAAAAMVAALSEIACA